LWKRQPAMLLLLRILKRRDKEESRRRNLWKWEEVSNPYGSL
jgi:hypothetical protein